MAEVLPEEFIIETISCLPVKSALRFRCLSKFLCAVIDTPDYIDSHLRKSSQNFNLRKLISQNRSSKKFDVYDVNFDLEEEILRIGKPVSSSWNVVGGYCKGLLLLYRNNPFGLAMWNPSTRQYRNLPDFSFELPYTARFDKIVGSGLLYDDSIDDYKPLLIARVRVPYVIYREEVQVWIYGLKSNIWKRAQNFRADNLLGYEMYRNDDYGGIGYFADGCLHWLFLRSRDRRTESGIVAYDVVKDTFSLVALPVCSSMNSLRPILLKLHVLEGCLCVSYKTDLYIRKKDGLFDDMFTWTKLLSITEPEFLEKKCKIVKVLGYSKRGDKILLDLNIGHVVSYDIKEKSFRKMEIENHRHLQNAISCIESLVSVAGGGLLD